MWFNRWHITTIKYNLNICPFYLIQMLWGRAQLFLTNPRISLWGFSRLQSKVHSGQISSPSILWVYLLPARMKKIQSKMKALEWSQHYSLIFQTLKGSLSSKVSDGIFLKFKLIQAFMDGLVTCKEDEDPTKNEGTRVVTTFSPL